MMKNSYEAILETKEYAEEMWVTLRDMLDTYGYVTVYDFYRLSGASGYLKADQHRGWRKLQNVTIERNRRGTYSIKLPKPRKLK